MTIREFLWPEERIDHIARHGVTPEEVEEVCFGRALVQRAKSEGANPVFYVLGQTATFCALDEPMTPQNIPQFDSIEELARFWDTHDLTDFEDQLEEVAGPVFQRGTVVRVPLGPKEAEAVREIAKARGVEYGELIRQWVLERIRHT